MERQGIWISLVTLAAMMTALVQPAARADTGDEVMDQAVHLLKLSTVVDRRGKHNLMLKAVRHLQDPTTRPLFDYLSGSEHPGLKIHGILGLAELSPDKQVDLALIAQIEDAAVQSTVITAAMDDELLSHEQAAQLLAWDGLADEVKVLVAVRLIGAGVFSDAAMLRAAMTNSKKLGAGALAAQLLTELDDPAGPAYLKEVVDTSDDPQREPVRAMLLQTALRHELQKSSPWAFKIAQQTDVDPALGLLALRTAMRFGEPGSVELWQTRFEQTESSPADRVRLALTALHLSPWLGPEVFGTLQLNDDPLLQAIGKAGAYIASGSEESGDAIAALLEMGHPMVNTWALGYAREHASKVDAQIILLGLILAYEHSPQRGKARRLDEAIEATQTLYEQSPGVAVKLLRPMILEPDRDKLLNQAILLGLVRSRAADAADVVEGIEDELNSADARGLAILLIARSGRTMDAGQMDELALLARGGGRLEDSLRIQAAWTYLTRTGHAEEALSRVLGQINR